MIDLLNLEELGARLRKVDKHLIALLSQRMKLSLQVEEWKKVYDQPILRPEVEDKRLEEVRDWAKMNGLNSNFAYSILYFIIKESCSVQISYLQDDEQNGASYDGEEQYQRLKKNLLDLTATIASNYDQRYDKDFFSTHSYRMFENKILKTEIILLKNKAVVLDIGCATGHTSFKLASHFNQIKAYDVSPAMIKQANKNRQKNNINNVVFAVVDIEEGIPQEDVSVSLIIMNLGTASDIRNIKQLLTEIERVLSPGGRFFLSFYNKNALFHKWFIPWPISLAAEINLIKHCLDVHWNGKIYSVYARAYDINEVKELFPKGLLVSSILTFPTISSILPNELFEERIVRQSIEKIDNQLSKSISGAYILVTGAKE